MYTLFLFSAGSCSYTDHIRHGWDVLCAAARSRGALAGSALLCAIRCRGVGLTGYVRYRAAAMPGRNGTAPRSKKKRGILILLSIPLIFDSVF